MPARRVRGAPVDCIGGTVGIRFDKLGVVIAAMVAYAVFAAPFATFRANRIVPGEARSIIEALPPTLGPLLFAILIACGIVALLRTPLALRLLASIVALAALALLIGVAGGYSSGSTILVAMQTPKNRSGWALGTLAAGIMAGNLVGPLVGGALPPLIGIRNTFFLAGGVIFLSFLATTLFIKEDPQRRPAATGEARAKRQAGAWARIPDKGPVAAMLFTGMLLMFATMSIEPILTVYVGQLVERRESVTLISGVVMSAAALGSILSASRLGKLADRIGHWNVITGALAVAALLLIPQAFVSHSWQLIVLRFLMGLALGGLLPCITTVIRHNVPDAVGGNVLGLSISAQYVGQVAGPLAGGFVGGHFGMPAVFLFTSALMALGAAYNWLTQQRRARTLPQGQSR